MAITTYSELQTAIGTWTNRSDLTSVVADLIAIAEAKIRRDRRILLINERSFTAAEGYSLPTDFNGVLDLYHDGSQNYGRIKIVDAEELAERKRRHGDTGVPMFAAIIDKDSGPILRFAPEPGSDYTLKLVYEATVPALSDTDTTNFVLTNHPDIYLFACLAEAAAYLMEPEQEARWLTRYEQAAQLYERDIKRRQYGGSLTPRPRHILGEGV